MFQILGGPHDEFVIIGVLQIRTIGVASTGCRRLWCSHASYWWCCSCCYLRRRTGFSVWMFYSRRAPTTKRIKCRWPPWVDFFWCVFGKRDDGLAISFLLSLTPLGPMTAIKYMMLPFRVVWYRSVGAKCTSSIALWRASPSRQRSRTSNEAHSNFSTVQRASRKIRKTDLGYQRRIAKVSNLSFPSQSFFCPAYIPQRGMPLR